MSSDKIAEQRDEFSAGLVDELGLALFLSAINRYHHGLLAAANALCVSGRPPIGEGEDSWRQNLEQLSQGLKAWLVEDRPATLTDLTIDVPLDSGIVSLEDFGGRLAEAIAESRAVQALTDEVALETLELAYHDDECLVLRCIGGNTCQNPPLTISLDRTADDALVLSQTIGYRPACARLRIARDLFVEFDHEGIATRAGDAARTIWERIAGMQPRMTRPTAPGEGIALGTLQEYAAQVITNVVEAKRRLCRALLVDFTRPIITPQGDCLNSGRQLIFTNREVVTIPGASGCGLDVTVWRKQREDKPWLDLHLELAQHPHARRRRRSNDVAIAVALEWDHKAMATDWKSLTANEPLAFDIPERDGGKLCVMLVVMR